MDDIRLELIQRFAEDVVVMNLHRPEFQEPGQRLMAKDTIELKPPLDLGIALLAAQAMAGGQDQDSMAPQAQGFSHSLTMILESAGMMRRIQIG